MKRVKKILCPVDFSEISDEALEIAIQMAEKFGSTFSILYVLPRPAYYDWTLTGMSNIVLDDYFEKSKKEAETKIKNLKQIIETDHPFHRPNRGHSLNAKNSHRTRKCFPL